jgi:hypothetical protein
VHAMYWHKSYGQLAGTGTVVAIELDPNISNQWIITAELGSDDLRQKWAYTVDSLGNSVRGSYPIWQSVRGERS